MPKNILVIDDDGVVSKSLCGLLKRSGYSADALEKAFDVVEKIKDEHIDLILVDIRMPEINGVELVKKIKEVLKSKNKPDIPVIFITGYVDSADVQEARKLGKVVFKPFENKEILDSIDEHM